VRREVETSSGSLQCDVDDLTVDRGASSTLRYDTVSGCLRREVERPAMRVRARVGRAVRAIRPRRLVRISIICVVAAMLVVVARVDIDRRCPCASRERVAYVTAAKLAFEAYGEWAVAHPDSICPTSIYELTSVLGEVAGDPWGRSFRMICTDDRVVIVSAGPDGIFGTSDDISNLRAPE
jgi:hypothetical protein